MLNLVRADVGTDTFSAVGFIAEHKLAVTQRQLSTMRRKKSYKSLRKRYIELTEAPASARERHLEQEQRLPEQAEGLVNPFEAEVDPNDDTHKSRVSEDGPQDSEANESIGPQTELIKELRSETCTWETVESTMKSWIDES